MYERFLSHVHYPDVHRNWSAGCQQYAGGDALLTKMRQGWEVAKTVFSEDHWHSGSRLVVVYHFDLKKGDEKLTMRVVSNPFVQRFIHQEGLTAMPLEAVEVLPAPPRREANAA